MFFSWYRNCLVGRGYQIKLADVAMCSGLYHKDYCEIGTRPPAPIRWLPWESILLVSKISFKPGFYSHVLCHIIAYLWRRTRNNANVLFIVSVCMHRYKNLTTLNRFSSYFNIGELTAICSHIPGLVKLDRQTLHMWTQMCFCAHLCFNLLNIYWSEKNCLQKLWENEACNLYPVHFLFRPPLWSSGQSFWLQIQRSRFYSQHCQISWEVVGLEQGSLSLVSTTEELLERKSSSSGLENREYGCRDPSRWPRVTLYPQRSALISPTSGGRSIGIVCSWTQATEFSLVLVHFLFNLQFQRQLNWNEWMFQNCYAMHTFPNFLHVIIDYQQSRLYLQYQLM
jgi:hypothetical protein